MKKLTLIDKAFLLKRTSPFLTLDLDYLFTIADKLGMLEYDKDDIIFVPGDEAHRMYFISNGEVEIQGKNEEVFQIKSGDFFGEESLFCNKPRNYTVKALADTSLLTLSRTHLMSIISECPDVALNFLHLYTSNFSTGRFK